MAINTVTGKCNARDLGFTLIHEHLTAGFPGWEFDNRHFDRKAEVEFVFHHRGPAIRLRLRV